MLDNATKVRESDFIAFVDVVRRLYSTPSTSKTLEIVVEGLPTLLRN